MRSLLDRKLARDLRSHLSALVAIAVVVPCGQAGFLAIRTMARTLERAQSTYYRTVRFPDLFATVRRAPDAVVETLRAIPGSRASRHAPSVMSSCGCPGCVSPPRRIWSASR